MPVEFVRSRQGKDQVVHDGHIYSLNREKTSAGSVWYCIRNRARINHCIARLYVKDNEVTTVGGCHNHSPDLALVERKRIITRSIRGGEEHRLLKKNGGIGLNHRASTYSRKTQVGKPAHFQWTLQSNRVLDQLESLYGNDAFPADLSLYSHDGKCVDAHKIVLSLCSPYFQDMFTKLRKPDKSTSTVVVLGNVSGFVLEELVKFMYTGKATVKPEHNVEFMKMIEMFRIEGVASSQPSKLTPGVKKSITVKVITNSVKPESECESDNDSRNHDNVDMEIPSSEPDTSPDAVPDRRSKKKTKRRKENLPKPEPNDSIPLVSHYDDGRVVEENILLPSTVSNILAVPPATKPEQVESIEWIDSEVTMDDLADPLYPT